MTKARIEPGKRDISIRNKERPRTSQDHDPRAELGLKSPAEASESPDREQSKKDAQGEKATRFDGNPTPSGAPSDTLKPRDDTPMRLKKQEGVHDNQGSTQTPQEQNRPQKRDQ